MTAKGNASQNEFKLQWERAKAKFRANMSGPLPFLCVDPAHNIKTIYWQNPTSEIPPEVHWERIKNM